MPNENKPPIDLPADLVLFLAAGKQLVYDPSLCEAGAVTLLPLAELRLQRFPVETSRLGDLFKQDPHYPSVNSYLVLGVNLVAACTGDYEHTGLLLWLPVEKRYGVWDSSHCGIQMFATTVTWDQIVESPAPHINAGWTGIDPQSPPMDELTPWPTHPYGDKQVYTPRDI